MNKTTRLTPGPSLRASLFPLLSVLLILSGASCRKEQEAASAATPAPASASKPLMSREEELDYQKWISGVKPGQTEEEVEKLLGRPAITTRGGMGTKAHYERPDIANRLTMHTSGALGATVVFVDGKVASILPILLAKAEPSP